MKYLIILLCLTSCSQDPENLDLKAMRIYNFREKCNKIASTLRNKLIDIEYHDRIECMLETDYGRTVYLEESEIHTIYKYITFIKKNDK